MFKPIRVSHPNAYCPGQKGRVGERGRELAQRAGQGAEGGGGRCEAENKGGHHHLHHHCHHHHHHHQDHHQHQVELKEPCPFLPSLSNSIDIEWTEARGRFAIANRPIPAGDLMIMATMITIMMNMTIIVRIMLLMIIRQTIV